jgi:tRNA(Ile)-lysidine synthase
MKLQLKVQNYIEKNKLLTSKGLVIVGVSGGADSVVLLHLLLKLGYNCAVAHCNFHLRANESDMDDLFVRKLVSELNIPYFSIDFETKKYAKDGCQGFTLRLV